MAKMYATLTPVAWLSLSPRGPYSLLVVESPHIYVCLARLTRPNQCRESPERRSQLTAESASIELRFTVCASYSVLYVLKLQNRNTDVPYKIQETGGTTGCIRPSVCLMRRIDLGMDLSKVKGQSSLLRHVIHHVF